MSLLKRRSLSTHPTTLPLFSQLSDEMNRFWGSELPVFSQRSEIVGGDWQPEIDIEQKKDMYLVRADIPGVDPKDIKVSIENGKLVVEGRRETEVEENRENFYRVERSCGSFYRSFNLPDAATNAKAIKAHSHNGVLEISVPISETAKQKKIEIKVD